MVFRWVLAAVTLVPLAACGAGRGDDAATVAAPKGAVVLFDGKDPSHWVQRRTNAPVAWPVSGGAMTSHGGDITTKDRYTDFQLHVEWMEPEMPEAHGQEKGNSGIGLQGRYEIQVLDSYGFKQPGRATAA